MRRIKIFEDFIEDMSLSPEHQELIKNWVKKYEKYYNFQDAASFESSVDQITKDCLAQLDLPQSSFDSVKDFISQMHDLSDGLTMISMVMDPKLRPNLNNIDQLTRFQY